jgi:hypothetical protein
VEADRKILTEYSSHDLLEAYKLRLTHIERDDISIASHQEKVLCFNMYVTDANMHVPAPMSTSWQNLAWHLKTPTCHFKTSTWHFKTSTWHFKTPNMVFQNSEHGVSLGAGHAPATTLWRARASVNGCFD